MHSADIEDLFLTSLDRRKQLSLFGDAPETELILGEILVGKDRARFIRGEFWTSQQRQSHNLHEISYRACFKAQLPRFFITRLTEPDDIVYDPFSGRGTTALEAALLGRHIIANDCNPLSRILSEGRLFPPTLAELSERLDSIDFAGKQRADLDLSMFYHQKTEEEIVSLRHYLISRKAAESEDHIDRWIRMVATNRLTGHSPGFFSVYTLPPNQAVTQERQKKINAKRKQVPEYKDVRKIIVKKSKSLLKTLTALERERLIRASKRAILLTGDARNTDSITNNSVTLTVTSPPFLDIVQYAADNWLRCWFNNLDTDEISARITMTKTVQKWSEVMKAVFQQLYRITRPGGWVAFEVGEVRKGKVKLEEEVLPLGKAAGFICSVILINEQQFTKTANIWGVDNNTKGTNSNRIVVFRKE